MVIMKYMQMGAAGCPIQKTNKIWANSRIVRMPSKRLRKPFLNRTVASIAVPLVIHRKFQTVVYSNVRTKRDSPVTWEC